MICRPYIIRRRGRFTKMQRPCTGDLSNRPYPNKTRQGRLGASNYRMMQGLDAVSVIVRIFASVQFQARAT